MAHLLLSVICRFLVLEDRARHSFTKVSVRL